MRKNAIIGLIKAYRDLKTSEETKKELKKALKYELSLIIHEPEDKITDYLLNDWMDNEMRTELEEQLREKFGIEKTNAWNKPIATFKLPNLDKL